MSASQRGEEGQNGASPAAPANEVPDETESALHERQQALSAALQQRHNMVMEQEMGLQEMLMTIMSLEGECALLLTCCLLAHGMRRRTL